MIFYFGLQMGSGLCARPGSRSPSALGAGRSGAAVHDAAAGVAEVGRISIPQLVREAKRLRLLCPFWRRRRPKGGQRSLREISAELAQRGITNERGKPSLERRLTRCSTECDRGFLSQV
jgi:hypothetical protein